MPFGAGDFVVGRLVDASLAECLFGVALTRVVHTDRSVVLARRLVGGVEPPFWGATVAFGLLVERTRRVAEAVDAERCAPAVRRLAWAVVPELSVREQHDAPVLLVDHDEAIRLQARIVGVDDVGRGKILNVGEAPLGKGRCFECDLADLDDGLREFRAVI